jgi:glucose/arabinose dehydrogenase
MLRILRPVASRAAVTLAVATLASGSPLTSRGNDLSPVIEDLDGPRGVAVGPGGRVLFAEGSGSFSELVVNGHKTGAAVPLGAAPASYIAPAVAHDGGQFYVLTAGGPPGSGAATLYKATPGHALLPLADIAHYQEGDPDPFNVTDDPEESNPFGVASLRDSSVLVSDAAANDLLRVYPNGRVITVARLMPRTVAMPAGLPIGPPAGTPVLSEAVATSVAVGADGYYYVGELRGFPATPGTSQIWRIAPDSVDAVCDPASPNTGACRRYADGFTSIVDLEAAPDGSLYVVQLVQQSWLQWELDLVNPPIGGLYRLAPGGGSRTELAPGELILPGGVGVGGGAVYVSAPVFGPGAILRVQ